MSDRRAAPRTAPHEPGRQIALRGSGMQHQGDYMKRVVGLMVLGLCTTGTLAKLPPVSDDAKAKAAEAAAKTAHGDKVSAYKLCQSMDRVASTYLVGAKKAGKDVKPVATPPCSDPGAFAYTPPAQKPLEASGAHSPPGTATSPPSNKTPAAEHAAGKKS